jgi:hypothetical protein
MPPAPSGASGLRILHALAEGETNPKQLALLGDDRLKWLPFFLTAA